MKTGSTYRNHRLTLLFFAFLAVLLLAFNGYISLWDQDEAAYAGFAKRMLETGRWIIPDFTWSEIHRKPPLHFWLMALSYKIFGINTFAVRFFSALAVWSSLALMWFRGSRLFGRNTARVAVWVLAGNVFVMMLGKMAVTDGLLLFFYTWAGLALAAYLQEGRGRNLAVFYLAVALGTLVKGPPMLLWAGFMFLLLLIFYPGRKRVLRTRPWLYGWFALLPFGGWLYAAWRQNPDFVRWWADWYILRRTHSAVLNQTGPPGTYLLLFVLFFLPVLPLLAGGWAVALRRFRSGDARLRYAVLWFVAGWLPYAFLPSKLPAYVLAAYPALALLMGYATDYMRAGHFRAAFRWAYYAETVLWLLMAVAAGSVAMIRPHSLPPEALWPLVLLAAVSAFLTWSTYRSLHFYRQGRYRLAVHLLLLQGLVWVTVLFGGVLPLAEPMKNATRRVALALQQSHSGSSPVIIANHFAHPPSLPFYLEKYNPGRQIIIPPQPDGFVQKHLARSSAVWILSPAQWQRFRDEQPQEAGRFRAYRIGALNTGAVGKNDYILLVPSDILPAEK